MSVLTQKVERRLKIKKKIRSRVFGTPEKPRFSVFRSNCDIYVQLIDDVHSKTLASASSKSIKEKLTKTEKSVLVGKAIAEKCLSIGITSCVFDRNGYLYHGRVKSLADSAREAGLKF
ncbi:MAG: 50S ribosomal protein L18 [Bacteroidia bacterium]|nr:50S ribosomal protein L18 [Bacteroidia bacterium]MCZ2141317.1 50S ribosomal protein L18 [Bacteroidia bacterium]